MSLTNIFIIFKKRICTVSLYFILAILFDRLHRRKVNTCRCQHSWYFTALTRSYRWIGQSSFCLKANLVNDVENQRGTLLYDANCHRIQQQWVQKHAKHRH